MHGWMLIFVTWLFGNIFLLFQSCPYDYQTNGARVHITGIVGILALIPRLQLPPLELGYNLLKYFIDLVIEEGILLSLVISSWFYTSSYIAMITVLLTSWIFLYRILHLFKISFIGSFEGWISILTIKYTINMWENRGYNFVCMSLSEVLTDRLSVTVEMSSLFDMMVRFFCMVMTGGVAMDRGEGWLSTSNMFLTRVGVGDFF